MHFISKSKHQSRARHILIVMIESHTQTMPYDRVQECVNASSELDGNCIPNQICFYCFNDFTYTHMFIYLIDNSACFKIEIANMYQKLFITMASVF